MNIHYLQHVPFEGLGSIEQWALSHGHPLTVTRLYANDQLPTLDRFDMLVVMGGPMSIHDEHEYVWLKAEKWFIEQVISAGKPVLGICLGGQLIAEVLGGMVYAGKEKEIGWFPISFSEDFSATDLGKRLPSSVDVFHWHGETFSIPNGATRIASSTACENQGFIFNERVIALQFHLEMTLFSAESIIANSSDELIDAPYIQSKAEMLGDENRFSSINAQMGIFLDYLQEQAQNNTRS